MRDNAALLSTGLLCVAAFLYLGADAFVVLPFTAASAGAGILLLRRIRTSRGFVSASVIPAVVAATLTMGVLVILYARAQGGAGTTGRATMLIAWQSLVIGWAHGSLVALIAEFGRRLLKTRQGT